MLELGTLVARVTMDATRFERGAARVQSDVARLSRNATTHIGQMSRNATADLDRMAAGMRSVGNVADGLTRQLAVVGGAIVSFKAVSAGLRGIGTGIGLAAEAESTAVAFEVLIGSASKAQKTLASLTTFAAETPFEMPELTDAARKLIAFGTAADAVTPELRMIGDIASGIQQPIGEIAEIYGKARVQGRLFAQDINQLTGRGIPVIQELAKQFKVTDSEVKKLVESGRVNFSHLERAFQSLTSEGGKFAGMMERQSQTVLGQYSTFKDEMSLILKGIGEDILAEIDTKTVLADVKSITKIVADDLTPAIRSAAEAVGGITEGFADARMKLIELKEVLSIFESQGSLSEAMAAQVPQGVRDFGKSIDESAFGKWVEGLTGQKLIGIPELPKQPVMQEVLPATRTPEELTRMETAHADKAITDAISAVVSAPEQALAGLGARFATFSGQVAEAAPKIEKWMTTAGKNAKKLNTEFESFAKGLRTPEEIVKDGIRRLHEFESQGLFEGRERLMGRAREELKAEFLKSVQREQATPDLSAVRADSAEGMKVFAQAARAGAGRDAGVTGAIERLEEVEREVLAELKEQTKKTGRAKIVRLRG